ncbi:MAG: serine/threonine-protein kinase [Planctomycetota bacterium]
MPIDHDDTVLPMPDDDEVGGTTHIDEGPLLGAIVERGFATDEEVDTCRMLTRQSFGGGDTVCDLLIKEGMVTRRQIDRLAAELEAERSKQRIPGYRIHETIGKGSSGLVLRATHVALDRVVAIKVLPRRLAESNRAVESFYAEGRSAAALNHPNIVQAFDVGKAGDCHYFVMEFVEGKTVYEVLREQAYAEEEALDLVIAIADALQHAHQKDLVHRDVKPKNIMITSGGIPKLADLGLARLISDEARAQAEKGRTLGTPYYISPEQIRGDMHIGPESDIYSLGATFYHMVVGRPPFEGRSMDEVFKQHLSATPEPAVSRVDDLQEGVSEVIEKMMAKAPEARYRDCETLLTDLRAWKALAIMRRGEEAAAAARRPKDSG